MNTTIRLQKFIAQRGIASRRTAEAMIKAGRVSVDGTTVTEMGIKIDPQQQTVSIDGAPIGPEAPEPIYILLNKPKGYVTTLSDPQGRPVVTTLLKGITARVFPVGRLDIDTEGALLLTNDGELTQRILHPRQQTTKTYEATISGVPERRRLTELEQGIMLEGRKTWPAVISVVGTDDRTTRIRITIHEGRKRQVRKMFAAIGHPVIHLRRIAYGRLTLGSLKSGSYRFVNKNDLEKIFL